jgi:hypothetical protein
LSLESKYEAIMHFLRRGYRYFALHDTIVGIRPNSIAGEVRRRCCVPLRRSRGVLAMCEAGAPVKNSGRKPCG